MSRAVIGGWSRYPAERAVAAGQIAGTASGAGIAVVACGGNPYIGAALLLGGGVLTLAAWQAAESHRPSGSHGEDQP